MRRALVFVAMYVLVCCPHAYGANLLRNGDAEAGRTIGWVNASPPGNAFHVTGPLNPLITGNRVHGGRYSFWAGVNPGFRQEMYQNVSLLPYQGAIARGRAKAIFIGYAQSSTEGASHDTAEVIVEFRTLSGTIVGRWDSGPVPAFNPPVWREVKDVQAIPHKAQQARVRLIGQRRDGTSTDAFFDDLGLSVVTR